MPVALYIKQWALRTALDAKDSNMVWAQSRAGQGRAGHLKDRHQQLVSSILLPAKLVQAEAAQQLQVGAAVRELVLVLIHLGVLVRLDHRCVGECLRHIPILAQACNRFLFHNYLHF